MRGAVINDIGVMLRYASPVMCAPVRLRAIFAKHTTDLRVRHRATPVERHESLRCERDQRVLIASDLSLSAVAPVDLINLSGLQRPEAARTAREV